MAGVVADPDELAGYVVDRGKRVSLSALVEDRLHDSGLPELTIAEKVDEVVNRVRVYLRRKNESRERDGLSPFGRFGGPREEIWIPLSVGRLPLEDFKKRLRGLDGHDFEKFCVYLVRTSGYRTKRTPRLAKEGGMDFYGEFHIFTTPSILQGVHIRFLGQATKSAVNEADLKQFTKEIDDYCLGKGRAFRLVDPHFRDTRSPLMGLYFSVRGFSRDAVKYAAGGRCILIDSRQIADFVAIAEGMAKVAVSSADLKKFVSELPPD